MRGALFKPKTDRDSVGGSITLSEGFGAYSFSQTLSRQDLPDRASELSNNTTAAVTLTAAGAFRPWLSLRRRLSHAERSSIVVGQTDVPTASLQPVVNTRPRPGSACAPQLRTALAGQCVRDPALRGSTGA